MSKLEEDYMSLVLMYLADEYCIKKDDICWCCLQTPRVVEKIMLPFRVK